MAEVQEASGVTSETDFDQFRSKTSYLLPLKEGVVYNIALESVLSHHSDSVSSVSWFSQMGRNEVSDLGLVSSSFDFSVVIWHAPT